MISQEWIFSENVKTIGINIPMINLIIEKIYFHTTP